MLEPSTLQFLVALKKNNSKEWFDKNRALYERAKLNVQEFVGDFITELQKYDSALSGLEAKKCLFRINRDVRFAKDKSPYKTNFGAYISPGGKKANLPGYYIHIDANAAFLAGGVWMPEPLVLNAIRQEIDYNFDEFKKLLSAPAFKKHFGSLSEEDKLVNVPKGFDKLNPAADYLKLKSFIMYSELSTKELLSKTCLKKSVETCRAMAPMNLFLRRALD